MRARVTFDNKALVAKMRGGDKTVNNFIKISMRYHARRAQSYARRNAVWTDRTGVARGGLFAKAQSNSGHHAIIVSHSASYGIWLEVAHSGRFAIIRPTIAHEGPELMETLAQGWPKIFGGAL